MRNSGFIILSIFICISCGDHGKRNKSISDNITSNSQNEAAIFPKDTQLVIYSGLITLPKGWSMANDDTLPKTGDATARYRFLNKKGKIIYLQYGLGTIGNPAEPDVLSARFRKGYTNQNADTSDIIFSDNPRLPEMRNKSNYYFSTRSVSSFTATFFKPKQIGRGFTGIYIDSIGLIGGNISDLVLYAEGLDSLETLETETVIQSLVIKDNK